jgi:hypothetical protein
LFFNSFENFFLIGLFLLCFFSSRRSLCLCTLQPVIFQRILCFMGEAMLSKMTVLCKLNFFSHYMFLSIKRPNVGALVKKTLGLRQSDETEQPPLHLRPHSGRM